MDIRLEVKRLYSMVEDHIILDLVREFGEEFARRKIYFYLKWLIEKASNDGREVTKKDVISLSRKMKSFMKEDKEKEDLKSIGRKYPREKLSTNRTIQFHEFRDIITDIYRVFDRKYNEARISRIWSHVKNLTPYDFQLVVDALCDTRRNLPLPNDFIQLSKKMISINNNSYNKKINDTYSPRLNCEYCGDIGFLKYNANDDEFFSAFSSNLKKYSVNRMFIVCVCYCSKGKENLKMWPSLEVADKFNSLQIDKSLLRPDKMSVNQLIQWWKYLINTSNDFFEIKKISYLQNSKTVLEQNKINI